MKAYELIIIQTFNSKYKTVTRYPPHYTDVKSHWIECGGTINENVYFIIYGNDTILSQFLLTYPHSPYTVIKEITQ